MSATDPILGHTAHVVGVASKDGVEIAFDAQIDIKDGKQMVGAPFVLEVDEQTTATPTVQVLTNDPYEIGETLFDGLDFGALDADGDGQVTLVPFDAGHNILMKTMEVHDHYFVDVPGL